MEQQKKQKARRQNLTLAILSLSLLTVMAGAAVAPALGVIKEYFAGSDPTLVQMIISVPAIFIVITNMAFPALCRKHRTKSLLMTGLFLYTVGGCIAGLFSNIYIVLACRALVGIGVGIIMPMSTGLLTFYYTRDKQDRLMGYSSAMNQMGGAVATLLSGVLSGISWRASFLVYLLGLISIVLCLAFLPNERIGSKESGRAKGVFREYYPFIVAMFFLMLTFFVFPAEFAIETAKEGIIGHSYVAIIMAGMDIVAFLGGLSFVHVKARLGEKTKFVAPLMFLIGYLLLELAGGWIGALGGSLFIGFANGLGIPFIISTASKKAGRAAATAVIPLISAALYLAQFLTPMILTLVKTAFSGLAVSHMSYCMAAVTALFLTLWSCTIKADDPGKESCRQEE